jgi:hypothetical protein
LLAYRIRPILGATIGDAPMSEKLEQIAVRLEPELREKLQRAADHDHRPLASMIRLILHNATKQAPDAGAHAA